MFYYLCCWPLISSALHCCQDISNEKFWNLFLFGQWGTDSEFRLSISDHLGQHPHHAQTYHPLLLQSLLPLLCPGWRWVCWLFWCKPCRCQESYSWGCCQCQELSLQIWNLSKLDFCQLTFAELLDTDMFYQIRETFQRKNNEELTLVNIIKITSIQIFNEYEQKIWKTWVNSQDHGDSNSI